MENFSLSNYVSDIKQYMTQHKVSADTAVNNFIVNLATMRPTHEGFNSEINFHQLGQEWNSLKYTEKNRQKAEVLSRVRQNSRRTDKEV